MPLVTTPYYPIGFNPNPVSATLYPPAGGGRAKWFGGTEGMREIIWQRQGGSHLPIGPYLHRTGTCSACIVQLPTQNLEVEHVIPYATLLQIKANDDDLVRMHNDTANLTFMCKSCNSSKSHDSLYDWLFGTIANPDTQTRLAIRAIGEAWLATMQTPANLQIYDLAYKIITNTMRRPIGPPIVRFDHGPPPVIWMSMKDRSGEVQIPQNYNLASEVETVSSLVEGQLLVMAAAGVYQSPIPTGLV